MSSAVYKSAELTETRGGEFEFVASTATRDRYGDIVVQDWDLSQYKRNPIVLFGHDSTRPVGTATHVAVEKGKLVSRLKLADEGTSADVDFLRKLVAQNIIRAVSVGFLPGKSEIIRSETGDFTGFRYSQNALVEISLVSVPANPQALAVARSLDISDEFTARAFAGVDPAPFLSRKRAIINLARAKQPARSK